MVLHKIKEERKKIQKEIKEKTTGYILAALGLVAGLAWNEAIKSFIVTFFPNPGNNVLANFLYAIAVTIFIVLITVYLLRFSQRPTD